MAEEYFLQSLIINPKEPYALLNLAVIYRETRQEVKYADVIKKVDSLDPKIAAEIKTMLKDTEKKPDKTIKKDPPADKANTPQDAADKP